MSKFFLPLKIFFFGNIFLLVLLLLFPAIGASADQLQSDTASIAGTFWGWTWAVGGTRLWIWLAAEMTILFLAAKAFLDVR